MKRYYLIPIAMVCGMLKHNKKVKLKTHFKNNTILSLTLTL